MQLFTTAEAARYLRLKERKIYEMVAEGSVPCTKVTGRWLFPKAELDHWLASSVTRPAGMTRSAAGADRRRQPRSAAGMGDARERLRAGHARGRQRSRFQPLRRRGGDRRGHASACLGRCGSRRQCRRRSPTGATCRMRCSSPSAAASRACCWSLAIRSRSAAIDDAIAKRARVALRPAGAGAQLLLLIAAAPGKSRARLLAAATQSARPGPISRKRSVPAAPMSASPPVRSPIRRGSTSCRSSGSRSISCCGSATISVRRCRR